MRRRWIRPQVPRVDVAPSAAALIRRGRPRPRRHSIPRVHSCQRRRRPRPSQRRWRAPPHLTRIASSGAVAEAAVVVRWYWWGARGRVAHRRGATVAVSRRKPIASRRVSRWRRRGATSTSHWTPPRGRPAPHHGVLPGCTTSRRRPPHSARRGPSEAARRIAVRRHVARVHAARRKAGRRVQIGRGAVAWPLSVRRRRLMTTERARRAARPHAVRP
jgi:hypothetical protein